MENLKFGKRKGITELKRPVIGFLVLLIAIVVVFTAFETTSTIMDNDDGIACVGASGANCTLGENATITMEGAVDDIVSWLPLLALVIVAGVVIAYTSGAFKGV